MNRTLPPLAVLTVVALSVTACGSGGADDASPPAAASTSQALTGHDAAVAVKSWTPWPQALHDARHSSATTVVGPQTGTVRWRRTLEGNVTPGPVIAADGTIYAASNGGVLHALDPATGKDVWTLDGGGTYGSDQSTSPAVLPDGTILWPGPQSTLVAVSPTGRMLWKLAFGAQVTSPAVEPDGTVVVGDAAGLVRLLRPDTSGPNQVWEADLGAQSYGSPVFSPDAKTVYQTVTTGVSALSVADGSVVWTATPASDIIEVSAAVAPDGTVVVGTNDGHEYGLEPADGSTAWAFDTGVLTYSSPGVTDDGVAYFGDHANRVDGVDAATGTLDYRYAGPTDNGAKLEIWTSVAVDASHDVYAGTTGGLVEGAAPDGSLLFAVPIEGNVDSYPAIGADGALIIGTTGGELISIADE